MKQLFSFLLFHACLIIMTCKSLPLIEHRSSSAQLQPYFFLESKYQLTHSIKAELPNREKALLIGLIEIDPSIKSIHAVLMSIEGLVLLDVIYKDNVSQLNRAVPPFDSSNFSNGLLDDLKLIFFIPDGKPAESGIIKNIGYAERYRCDDGKTTDVVTVIEGIAVINKYDSGNSITRTARILSENDEGVPSEIELIAHGFFGYSLYLELISSERIK